MVAGERTSAVRVAREGHEANQVVRPTRLLDEVPEHLLDDVEAAHAGIAPREVPGLHRSRAIDHHGDRDALAVHLAGGVACTRAGQGDRQRNDREGQQRRGHWTQARPQRARSTVHQRQARERHRRRKPSRQQIDWYSQEADQQEDRIA